MPGPNCAAAPGETDYLEVLLCRRRPGPTSWQPTIGRLPSAKSLRAEVPAA